MRENSEEVVRERESQCKLREPRELERREREHREHRELERTETLWVTVFFFFFNVKMPCNFFNIIRVNEVIYIFNNLCVLLSLQISPIWGN